MRSFVPRHAKTMNLHPISILAPPAAFSRERSSSTSPHTRPPTVPRPSQPCGSTADGSAPQHRPTRSRLRVTRRINQPRNSRMKNRPRTHRARLQRHVERAPFQPVVPQHPSRRPHRHDLGMSRRVAVAQNAVIALGDNRALVHNNRAYRHLAIALSNLRLGNRLAQEVRSSTRQVPAASCNAASPAPKPDPRHEFRSPRAPENTLQ